MRAAVCTRYGPPEVIQIAEVEKPAPNENEVLIRVRAAAVNPLDGGLLKGRPYFVRLMTGLRKPKNARPGVDLAGEVEAIGRNVTRFTPGDSVFGVCTSNPKASGAEAWVHRLGAFAEYVCAPESALAVKPENVTFEQAACVPVAAFTALQGLRDRAQVKPDQKVLVNGASGGVGTFAVQIAKAFGAEVTGVCSTRNLDMVRSLGADHVIDYTDQNFTKLDQRYDVILDCAGNYSLRQLRRVLRESGRLIMVGDLTGRGIIGMFSRLIKALVVSRFGKQKLIVFLAKPNHEDLVTMHDLIKAGKVSPVIDKRYRLDEVAEAIRYLETKHARGKIVITPDLTGQAKDLLSLAAESSSQLD